MMNANRPLEVVIKDGQLIVRIGLDVLAYSAEQCRNRLNRTPLLVDSPGEYAAPYAKVVDKMELARDVKHELMREKEDGTMPIHVLLDNAILAAFEDGSTAFDEHFKPHRLGE
jgi:hypothetical protein